MGPTGLRRDLRFALFTARVFSALAGVLLLLAAAVNLVDGGRGRSLLINWQAWGALWLVAPATAFGAALLAGVAGHLLRPLRTGVAGWCLSGIAVAVSIYLAVGAALTVFFNPVGAYFLGESTRADAWALFPTVSFVVVATGAAIGTYIGMRQRTGSPVL